LPASEVAAIEKNPALRWSDLVCSAGLLPCWSGLSVAVWRLPDPVMLPVGQIEKTRGTNTDMLVSQPSGSGYMISS